MSSHTPGPWELGGMFGHEYVKITTPEGKVIGAIRDCEKRGLDNNGFAIWEQTEEGRANARLVAASPRLLTACQSLLDVLGRSYATQTPVPINCPEAALAQAAIAQAIGRED